MGELWKPALLLVALIVITNLPVPWHGRLASDLQDAGHAPLFGVAALVLLHIFRRNPRPPAAPYALSLTGILIFGIVTELVQGVLGRDAAIRDVMTDVAGAASFLAVDWSRGSHATKSAWRWAARLAAATMLAVVFTPPAQSALRLLHRNHVFPVLVEFDSVWSRRCCEARNARIEIVQAPRSAAQELPGRMARLTFLPGHRYPGLSFREPFPDWRGYTELSFTIYSENQDAIRLGFRIHDREHNNETLDRFNTALEVHRGLNRIRIPLEDILRAPAGRLMDMGRISSIILFAISPRAPLTIYLGKVLLR